MVVTPEYALDDKLSEEVKVTVVALMQSSCFVTFSYVFTFVAPTISSDNCGGER